jgi:FtsP/CotA-like multicopper oxidase with cupredoxin domain
MSFATRIGTLVIAVLHFSPGAARSQAIPRPTTDALIVANDNRRPGGAMSGDTLRLRLVAEEGRWQPEGAAGRTLTVQAFREESGQLTTPGPLVRVRAGTHVHVSIRNNLPGQTITIFGLVTRPASAPSTALEVPPGQTREVRFLAGAPGTYHYWATTTARPLSARGDIDSQLNGAFVIDPTDAIADDRILVISLWRKPGSAPGSVDIGAVNGRSWPFSEILDYRVGVAVRWRIVNLSLDQHAMHLHGRHFRVRASGDGLRQNDSDAAEAPLVVTEFVAAGETYEMEWAPERPGNWLFHCHMVSHMTPDAESPRRGQHRHDSDSSGGMAGIVVGIRVTGDAPARATPTVPSRRLTLRMLEETSASGQRSGYRIHVDGTEAPRLAPGSTPGPVMVLTRGEPVEVDLVNEMRDPTAMHWHGIELDSYFDGVPGWGGTVGSTTPAIAPGQRFTAKFTPPRAGTFIYHTHWHDDVQLSGGLYGALIVVEPGDRYDSAIDHIFIAAYNGPQMPGQREPIVLNGRSVSVPAPAPGPAPVVLRANQANRVRLINITPANAALTFVLTDGFATMEWTPLAKDGADVSSTQRRTRAARQIVSVGETYDFEIHPLPNRPLWLELRRGNGEWVAQMLLVAQ